MVRAARVDDANGIADVHVTAWQETYRGLIPDSVLDTLSVERRTRQWRHTLEDRTDVYHLALVVEVGNRIVGFVNYGRAREYADEYQGEIFALYVLKEFHGCGLGRGLVRRAAEELLALGMTSMLVWVLADNPARRFYEHLGGVAVGEKNIEIGGESFMEQAYGWKDIGLWLGDQA